MQQKVSRGNSGMRMNKVPIQIDTELANADYEENQKANIASLIKEFF